MTTVIIFYDFKLLWGLSSMESQGSARDRDRVPKNFQSPGPKSRKFRIWVPVPVPDFKMSPGPRFPGPGLRDPGDPVSDADPCRKLALSTINELPQIEVIPIKKIVLLQRQASKDLRWNNCHGTVTQNLDQDTKLVGLGKPIWQWDTKFRHFGQE